MLGCGTYFADRASYSSQGYQYVIAEGRHQLILADVLIGAHLAFNVGLAMLAVLLLLLRRNRNHDCLEHAVWLERLIRTSIIDMNSFTAAMHHMYAHNRPRVIHTLWHGSAGANGAGSNASTRPPELTPAHPWYPHLAQKGVSHTCDSATAGGQGNSIYVVFSQGAARAYIRWIVTYAGPATMRAGGAIGGLVGVAGVGRTRATAALTMPPQPLPQGAPALPLPHSPNLASLWAW